MKNLVASNSNLPSVSSFGPGVVTQTRDPKNNFLLEVNFLKAVDPVEWIEEHRSTLLQMILDHGVVYLNGINLRKETVVHAVSSVVGEGNLLDSYAGGVTSRPRVDLNLFLTTVVAGSGAILQHHEMAYMASFPKKIFFFCDQPAEHGGATPVAYSRTIKRELDAGIFRQFKKRGICYVRNYHSEISSEKSQNYPSWKKAFEVKSKKELAAKAKALGFEYEWNGDRLRTYNRREAVITHPTTGEEFLFNHSFVLHWGPNSPMTRGPGGAGNKKMRARILALAEMDRPYVATWGDNREIIDMEILEEVFKCYNDNKHSVDWRKGNLMLIDNILASHGRDQFMGDRTVMALLSKV